MYSGPKPPTPPALSSVKCTKCGQSSFVDQTELHCHILECAGVLIEAIGPPSKKRRKRSRRRARRGLKRNIPQTPQKLPPKQRTKPGDSEYLNINCCSNNCCNSNLHISNKTFRLNMNPLRKRRCYEVTLVLL